MSDLTADLLAAILSATPERKAAALHALKGTPPLQSVTLAAGPLLMSMGKAAVFLGVGRSTLWRMIRSGRLVKVELFPGCFRIRRADLESLAINSEVLP